MDLNIEPIGSNIKLNAALQAPPAPQGDNEQPPHNIGHHKRNKLKCDRRLKVLLFLMNKAKEGRLLYGSIKLASRD